MKYGKNLRDEQFLICSVNFTTSSGRIIKIIFVLKKESQIIRWFIQHPYDIFMLNMPNVNIQDLFK
jgi:hypothetical protein